MAALAEDYAADSIDSMPAAAKGRSQLPSLEQKMMIRPAEEGHQQKPQPQLPQPVEHRISTHFYDADAAKKL